LSSIPNGALTNSTISGVSLGSNLGTLTRGSYLTGSNYNGSAGQTWAVDATSANTASKVVARDGSGNFSAGTITATLNGNASTATSATSATTATNADNINVDEKNDSVSYQVLFSANNGSGYQRPYIDTDNSHFTYNPSSHTLTCGTFSGALSGNATSATSATTATTATQVSNTLTMNVSGTGLSGSQTFNGAAARTFTVTSNATSANTASTIVARDSSGNFSAGTITASLSGNASTATSATSATNATNATNFNVLADNSTNATHYVIFTGGATGNQRPNSDTALYYNPSSNTLNAGNFNSTSDINKKTNLREVVDSLEILKGIRGVRFDWVENNLPSVGVIAQEVEQVLPELVTETEGVKSVNYNGLVGVLIEAVKELQAEVEELKRTR